MIYVIDRIERATPLQRVGNRSSLLQRIGKRRAYKALPQEGSLQKSGSVGNRGLTARGACLLLCLLLFVSISEILRFKKQIDFLWELLYPIKIPCWGALLGPV